MSGLICSILFLAVFFPNGIIGPLHASCRVNWTFKESCQTVSDKIVQQMNKWHTADTCNKNEKCLYTVKSASENEIIGFHETPAKHYKDDLKFTLTAKGQGECDVEGYSTSETWYAVLDYGTNYCNLHNLITGSGLDKVSGYTESTNDSKCTQYSSANCDKY